MKHTRRLSVAAIALLLGSGCGTRVHSSRTDAVTGGHQPSGVSTPASPDSPAAPAAEFGTGAGEGAARTADTPTATAPALAGSASRGAAGGASGRPPSDGSSAVPDAASKPPAAEPARGNAQPRAASPGTPSAPAPQPPARLDTRSAIVVASVGTYSGPVGSSLKPILDGAQLWAKHINHRGGVNGHPVALLVYDDGGDPARHRAQVQEAVEQRKAIGFLSNGETITGRGSIDYINDKRVPVIGTDGGENWPYQSPMYFPQASTGDALYGSFMPATAERVLPAGKRKLGTVVCEVQTCTEIKRVLDRDAPAVGFDHVYNGQASIAQPDYTAECLAARNAGVEVLFLVLDTNSIFRLVASCARQGFRPQYSAATALVADRFKENPNFEGFVAGTPIFPYFQTGSPATDEFQTAFKTFGRGLGLHIGLGVGWTAGELLETAARNMPEPPTSQSLLEGLWSIKDDTLGGITMPLTFVRDKPPAPRSCWFQIELKNGSWLSPNGFRLSCRQ